MEVKSGDPHRIARSLKSPIGIDDMGLVLVLVRVTIHDPMILPKPIPRPPASS